MLPVINMTLKRLTVNDRVFRLVNVLTSRASKHVDYLPAPFTTMAEQTDECRTDVLFLTSQPDSLLFVSPCVRAVQISLTLND